MRAGHVRRAHRATTGEHMRITTEAPLHGARIFCNGIEFTRTALVADEEEGVVESAVLSGPLYRAALRGDGQVPRRYHRGTVKIIAPSESS